MAKGRNIWLGLLLGWFVPGLGHFYMRRAQYGLAYALAVGALVAGGLLISGGSAINSDLHFWYFLCQVLAGPTIITVDMLRGQDSIYLGETVSVLRHQTGVVYVATAGVLNLIVICELYRRNANPEAPGPSDTMRVDAITGEPEVPSASESSKDKPEKGGGDA
jgi:hypothetical protein